MCTRLYFVLYLLGTSPQGNIYYLRTQKYTSQSGFARDFRSLLHLSNSPLQRKAQQIHPNVNIHADSVRAPQLAVTGVITNTF